MGMKDSANTGSATDASAMSAGSLLKMRITGTLKKNSAA